MYLYIRCALANRATLVGYACLIVAIALTLVHEHWVWLEEIHLSFFPLFAGCALLSVTLFGTGTLYAYKKALAELHDGMTASRFHRRWEGREYCVSRGAILAFHDYMKNRPPGN